MSSEEEEILFEPDADFEWALMEEEDTEPKEQDEDCNPPLQQRPPLSDC